MWYNWVEETNQMRTRIALSFAALIPIVLAGCGIARSLTTRHLDFDQNIVPSLNGGSAYESISDTHGPIGPLPFELQLTGDVRDKFDKYNGGVDSAYLTYSISNAGSADVRLRVWTIVAAGKPAFQDSAPLLLDVTVPAGQTVSVDSSTATRSEALRSTAENVLRNASVQANLYFESDSTAGSAKVTVNRLDVAGRAHGSLF